MSYLIFFVASFILINLIYRLFVINKENALKKMNSSKDYLLLCKISGLKKNKYEIKDVIKPLSITNAFIISLISTLVLLLENIIHNFYIWLIITFVLGLIILIPTVYISYKVLGNVIKKEGDKDV